MAVSFRSVALVGGSIIIGILLALPTHYLTLIACSFSAGALFALLIMVFLLSYSSTPIDVHLAATWTQGPSLSFYHPQVWDANRALIRKENTFERDPIYPASAAVSEAFDDLLALILRDYVWSWYADLSPNPSFPFAVESTVRGAIIMVRDKILGMDSIGFFATRLLPIITAHLKDFDAAETAIRGKNLDRDVTESEELDFAIAGKPLFSKFSVVHCASHHCAIGIPVQRIQLTLPKYRDGKLHPAASLGYADTKLLQQSHLRALSENIIPHVMPADQIRSRLIYVLLREILAGAILLPLMQMLSDPDTWNQAIVTYGKTALQDQKSVRKMRDALDAHASPPKSRPLPVFPRLSAHGDERSYERFIRAIRLTKNLSDARRFRSEVASQLKRETRLEPPGSAYLRRLETGKRLLDERVASLAADGNSALDASQRRLVPAAAVATNASALENASLRDILRDSAGLSYFMEFMDRQRRMDLVQFWLVVDGLRNPLEDDVAEDEEAPSLPGSWTQADRVDIAQISDAYLSKPAIRDLVKSQDDAVRGFLKAGRTATPLQYFKARQAILRTQTAALEEMETRHLPKFRQSDLFFKYLASGETAAPSRLAKVAPKPARMARSKSDMPRTGNRPTRSVDLAVAEPILSRPGSDTDRGEVGRQSLETGPVTALLDDDALVDPLSDSTRSLDQGRTTEGAGPDKQVVAAMMAALTDIIKEDDSGPDGSRGPIFDDGQEDPFVVVAAAKGEGSSARSSLEGPPSDVDVGRRGSSKPSITSLGLVGSSSSRSGVFADDDLFPEDRRFLEDEFEDPGREGTDEGRGLREAIHQAAPGDLGLSEAVAALTADIERLTAQDTVVDSLTAKAELTNNTAELRILRKSKASLERELRLKVLQREQYLSQEGDSQLYGRASVKITSVRTGTDSDGHEYAQYGIEVQRKAGEQTPMVSWTVARRYSEFHNLHQRLRAQYPSVRALEFPRRRMMMKLQREFVQKRRIALEQYLQDLLRLPDVCLSRDLRWFLSEEATADSASATTRNSLAESRDMITRFYDSVADGMDDLMANIPALDQLSIAGQSMLTAATAQKQTAAMTDIESEAELLAFETLQPMSDLARTSTPPAPLETASFIKPICDAFLELFSLHPHGSSTVSSWLRGRAVVLLLHQLVGGAIERRVRDQVRDYFSEETLLGHIHWLKEITWEVDADAFAKTSMAQAVKDGFGPVENRKAIGRRRWRKAPLRTRKPLAVAAVNTVAASPADNAASATTPPASEAATQMPATHLPLQAETAAKTAGSTSTSAKPAAINPREGPKPREWIPRTADEKDRTQAEAALLLRALVPDTLSSMVGSSNARAGTRRVLAAVNNRRLNTHLMHTLLDEIVRELFPVEAGRSGPKRRTLKR
ncbi:MAG: hypothetical protein M1825_004136 [Sarcosagium campestre]|nr:MAG: hypothetical protein M1825_004136 [Sarcosagium campestre]